MIYYTFSHFTIFFYKFQASSKVFLCKNHTVSSPPRPIHIRNSNFPPLKNSSNYKVKHIDSVISRFFFSNFRHHQKSSYARIISSLPLHSLYGLHNLSCCPSIAGWEFGEFCGQWREWRRRRRRNFTAALSTKYTV